MFRKELAVLIAALATNGAWAGPPGENTNGSTIVTLHEVASGDDSCVVQQAAAEMAMDSEVGDAAEAYALAEAGAMASGALDIVWEGDVTLNLTRHGKHGAVFQVDLEGAVSAGQILAVTSTASAMSGVELSADAEAEALSFVQAAADALAGFHSELDIVVASVSLDGSVDGEALSYGDALGYAIAGTEAQSSSTTSASASVTGEGSANSVSSVYVQGAHIEEFQAGLGLAAANVINVDTSALAHSIADAYATAAAVAYAEARAEASASMSLTFCYDLPLVDEECVDIFEDQDSAVEFAQNLVDNEAEIMAFAEAYAQAYGSLLAGSQVGLTAQVAYENLNGTEDLLTFEGVPEGQLTCGTATAQASASAEVNVE